MTAPRHMPRAQHRVSQPPRLRSTAGVVRARARAKRRTPRGHGAFIGVSEGTRTPDRLDHKALRGGQVGAVALAADGCERPVWSVLAALMPQTMPCRRSLQW